MDLVRNGIESESPKDAISDPLILEFPNLPELNKLVESHFEEALIAHLRRGESILTGHSNKLSDTFPLFKIKISDVADFYLF